MILCSKSKIQQPEEAKDEGVVINTIALMEPKAEEGLKLLAEKTGGQFSMVEKDGSVIVKLEAKSSRP